MNIFDVLTTKELRELPLKERFLTCMLAEKANVKFSGSIIDILVARNDMDRLKYFQEERRDSWEAYHVIKKLYQTEYGMIPEEIDKALDDSARELAEKTLIKCGWKEVEV